MRKIILCCMVLLWTACTSNQATREVVIFGAASTGEALAELAERYEAESGVKIRINSAASSTLARQIERGAPAHLFLSANPEWMDYLATRQRLESPSQLLLENQLVLVGPKHMAPLSLEQGVPAFEGRIAVADPSHVPAGKYTQQALEYFNWWHDLSQRMIPARDVRATLKLLTLGETTLAAVYASDAQHLDREHAILATFPARSHDPIRYPIAKIKGSQNSEIHAFYEFLTGPLGAEIFEKHGFKHIEQQTD